MMLEMAVIILSAVAFCICFFYLGYTLGGARERNNKWLMNRILLDELRFIQYDIDRLQESLIKHFLKDRNNKESNEQQ